MASSSADRTIVGKDGRILMFSVDQFVNDVCLGSHCFICGAAPETKAFNDEHIIPRWVLRRYNLFDRSINLPNDRTVKYGNYTVPCCADCNALLGRKVEQPISALLNGTYGEVVARMGPNEEKLLFTWLCLLFVKMHLKDRHLDWHKDPRRGDEKIGDLYDWPGFHHIFEVCRSPYTGAILTPEVLGSMCIFPVWDDSSRERYDLSDLSYDSAISIRLGDIGIAAVLDDSQAVAFMMQNLLKEITGALSCLQLKEITARMAAANSDLKSRPRFATLVAAEPREQVVLVGFRPAELEYEPLNREKIGTALLYLVRDQLDRMGVDGVRDSKKVAEALASGEVTFLFGEDGKFVHRLEVRDDPTNDVTYAINEQ